MLRAWASMASEAFAFEVEREVVVEAEAGLQLALLSCYRVAGRCLGVKTARVRGVTIGATFAPGFARWPGAPASLLVPGTGHISGESECEERAVTNTFLSEVFF